LTKTTALVLIPSRKKKVSAFVPLQKKSAVTHFFTEKNMPVLRYRTKVTILAPLYKKMCRYAFFYRKSAGTNSFKERNTGTLSFTKKNIPVLPYGRTLTVPAHLQKKVLVRIPSKRVQLKIPLLSVLKIKNRRFVDTLVSYFGSWKKN
jgi:hypothetical protein